MVYLITYDMNKPGQDYSASHESIKACRAWWHFLESTRLVYGNRTTDQISRRVRAHIDPNVASLF